MGVARTLKTIAGGAVFRVTGSRRFGRGLLEAYLSADEDSAVAAGMMLVQAKDRSVDLLAEELHTGRHTEDVLDVISSIETDYAYQTLREIAEDAEHPASVQVGELLQRRR